MPRHSDVVRKLRKVHRELSPILIAAGIETKKVDGIFTGLEVKEIVDIEIYLEKLKEFMADPAYRSFMDIWTARGPEWWANMRSLGETNLRPFKLLREASKPLRAAWRKTNGRQAKNVSQPDAIEGNSSGSGLQPA